MQMFFAVERLSQVHQQTSRHALGVDRLELRQFMVLAWLNAEGVVRGAVLARWVGTSRQRMQQVLAGLARRRLVERVATAWAGERTTGWGLTRTGEAVHDRCEARIRRLNDAFAEAAGGDGWVLRQVLDRCATAAAKETWIVVQEEASRPGMPGPRVPPRPGAAADWDP